MKLDICHRLTVDPCDQSEDSYFARVYDRDPAMRGATLLHSTEAYATAREAGDAARDWDLAHPNTAADVTT